jgi:tetratricopeptide (TPR) repeat protein
MEEATMIRASFLIGAAAVVAACGRPSHAPVAASRASVGEANVQASMATCSELGGEDAPRIAACTAVIQSSDATADLRAKALNNRGVLQALQGDQDRAIDDYDAAIAVNPGYAAAFYNRGKAWRRKGDAARAEADSAEAVRLDPNLAGH